MDFLTVPPPSNCPIDGYRGQAETGIAMWFYFLHRHIRDTLIILEEGNAPHPRCDMLVPWNDLNGRHITITQCSKGAERKRWQLAENDIQESVDRALQAYGRPLAMVPSFKYLERVLMEEYDDCPVVVGNLWNALKSWERLKRILGWEGTNP